MKNKRFRLLIAAAGLVAVMAAGCHKDDDMVTAKVHIDGFGGDKVMMDGVSPQWENGDSVCVNATGTPGIVSVSGDNATITMLSATTYKAVYPYSLVESARGYKFNLMLPRIQIYKVDADGRQCVKAPLGAYTREYDYGENLTLHFTPMGALLAVNIQNNYIADGASAPKDMTIDSVQLTEATHALWGEATVTDITATNRSYSIVENADSDDDDDIPHNTITLSKGAKKSMGLAVAANGSEMVYFYLPAISNGQFTVTVFAHDDDEYHSFTLSQPSGTTSSVATSQMATLGYSMSAAVHQHVDVLPQGAISGAFSVSATKQVYFAKGNLQYIASTGVWQFAEHQYDYIGGVAGNTTKLNDRATQAYAIDLYPWGTGNASSTSSYMPYGNSEYAGGGGGHKGPGDASVIVDIQIQKTAYEWGWYNSIVNGENEAGIWYTLTADEWEYLFNRTNSAGTYLYKGITVEGVEGVRILPDNWVWTDELEVYHSTTTLNAAQWALFEDAGAVFLPACGFGQGTNENNKNFSYTAAVENNIVNAKPGANNYIGYYWTATRAASDKTNYVMIGKNVKRTVSAGTLYGYRYITGANKENNKPILCAVRLVTDVPSSNNGSSKNKK